MNSHQISCYHRSTQFYYTEHKPSITIYVKFDEWFKITQWVWDNWGYIIGFIYFDHVYRLAPYEVISKQQYHELASNINK